MCNLVAAVIAIASIIMAHIVAAVISVGFFMATVDWIWDVVVVFLLLFAWVHNQNVALAFFASFK